MLLASSMPRTLTLLLVPAKDPDELDAMAYEDRRRRSASIVQLELLHAGEPDVLVRRALDIDQGVYGAAQTWDDGSVEQTSAIFSTEVASAAALLEPHLRDPLALAARFVEHAGSGEDAARVAQALVAPPPGPARGPAEEAASYVRAFLSSVPTALELRWAIVWELRTPAPCACAEWEGPTLGRYLAFPPRGFERLDGGGKYFGRMRCRRCGATFSFAVSADYAEATRETTPLPTEIGVFAGEVAAAIGGEVAFDIEQSPTCGVRRGRHCVLLVWRHGASYRVGLPHCTPWQVGSREGLGALVPTIERALADSPPSVSMADVIASLSPGWNLGLVGEPRPEEAVLHDARGEVHLRQEAASVTVTVFEGDTRHTREIATLDALTDLGAFVDEKLATQARTRHAARVAFDAEQAAAHAAMMQRVPTFDDVVGALREGYTVQVGGGRSFLTYSMPHGGLVVVRSDDGLTEASACSDEALRAAIAEAPDVFDSVVQDWLAGGSWNRR